MRMPKFNVNNNIKFSLNIRAKLLLLAGILMLALVATNLYMRGHLVAGSDALRTQSRIHETEGVATAALRAFGELKYWLTDLEVTWLNESEEMAEEAKAKLEEHLQALSVRPGTL